VSTPPRFRSRAFSTPQRFQANANSTALFHAATVSELSPSELSPREDHVPLSGTRAPLRLSTHGGEGVTRGLVTAGFRDSRAFWRSCLIPLRLWVSFPQAEACFPVSLDHQRRVPSLPPASLASKLSSLRESVRTSLSCPRLAVDALLVFSPSKDQTYSSLGTSTCLAQRTGHDQSPEDNRSRREGPSRPLSPGETLPTS
jgi:hypothetical protein